MESKVDITEQGKFVEEVRVMDLTGKVERYGTSITEAHIPGFDLRVFLSPYSGKKVRIVVSEISKEL